MDESYLELIDGQEITIDITAYHPDYSILNDRGDKASSGVWKHFGTLKHNDAIDRRHVYCIQCFINRKIKKYQRSTSTGNLGKHLKKHHNISLNQTYRVKKEFDSSIITIQKEENFDESADETIRTKYEEGLNTSNADTTSEEFLIHDINEILIAEIRKRPLLYNSMACQTEKGLKHQLRRQLWSEVYESLNHLIPYARLPKIWKNIRDRYHKVRRCMEGQGGDSSAKPKYRYYDLLRFLDPIDFKVSEDDKLPSSSLNEESDGYVVNEFLISNDHDNYITPVTSESVEKDDYDDDIYEPTTKKTKLDVRSTYSNKGNRARKVDIISVPLKTAECIETLTNFVRSGEHEQSLQIETDQSFFEQSHVDIAQAKTTTIESDSNIIQINLQKDEQQKSTSVHNNAEKREDQFDIFGRFVSEVMRNMTKAQAKRLQHKIVDFISECEIDSE